MKYETVNLDTWKRGNLFRFYIDNLRNVMSMTVDIDVSSLTRGRARAHSRLQPDECCLNALQSAGFGQVRASRLGGRYNAQQNG